VLESHGFPLTAGFQPSGKLTRLFKHQFARLRDLGLSRAKRLRDDALEIFEGVQIDIFQLGDRLLDEDLITNKEYVGAGAMIVTVIRKTDYIEHIRKEEGLGNEEQRVAKLNALQTMAKLFRSPVDFINYCDELAQAATAARKGRGRLMKDELAKAPALTLSTIHRAKGLEWQHVAVVDVVEGRFPHRKNQDQDEELRLLYVAITRAKENCIISYSGEETVYPNMLQEIFDRTPTIITGTENHSVNPNLGHFSNEPSEILTGS